MMDGSQQHYNAISNSNNGYPAQPGISPQQLNNNPHTTLPPLAPQQHATMSHMFNGSAPNTPRTPATPNTPGGPINGVGHFSQMGGQSRPYQPQQAPMGMQNNSYQQNPQYRTSASMMPQSSTAMSHPQPIAPAPPQGRMQQALRPMPPSGMMQQGMQSPYGPGGMLQQSSGMLDNMEPPTHVVGSQGRRGILPSAPGRPAVNPNGGKTAIIPTKDADGKFPCPHCTKTYLHAKHLKRHLLRHTGDRPYMCVLCRDTFSRSDILKRHFQKCSIRRGNPTGASHLSHAQAHLKKTQPHKNSPSMGNENDMMGGNGMHMQDPQLQHNAFGVIPDGSMGDSGSNLTDEQQIQQQLSQTRNSGLHQLNNGGRRGGDPNQGGSGRPSMDGGYAGMSSNNLTSGTNPLLANSPSVGQNTHSYSQISELAGNGSTMQPPSRQQHQSNSNDPTTMAVFQTNESANVWSQIYQQPSHFYVDGYNPNISSPTKPAALNAYIKQEPTHTYTQIKTEPHDLLAALYTGTLHVNDTAADFPNWNFQNDPLQSASNRLIYFCSLPGRPASDRMRQHLSPSSIKHFLEQFSNFHGHFPFIHMPSFRITEAYDGLILGMVCIGAVYSTQVSPQEVRAMMEVAKTAIETRSQVYSTMTGTPGDGTGSSMPELEHLIAIMMMHAMFTWHGTPEQRSEARQQFPILVTLARKIGLTQPTTTGACSILHQPRFSMEGFDASHFDWSAWVEQEKQSRFMYIIFLMDAARVLYFNCPPLFHPFEIQLPLPADDGAWDASTAIGCAEALGLYGPAAAMKRNPEGSRRYKQPEMHSALRALLHDTYDLTPCTTNLYSKFILVHALHVQLWLAQREPDQPDLHGLATGGATTPIGQYDWVTRTLDGSVSGITSSNNSSGRATPVELPRPPLKDTIRAFDKWKKAWDGDMLEQYPPPPTSYRRFGFCRDAVHFYYLAKCLMQHKQALSDTMTSDQRFSRVMSLLSYVKTWVVSDSAKRGEELGSVNDIDREYAITDLTLDMAQLFKPLDKQVDSAIAGMDSDIGSQLL